MPEPIYHLVPAEEWSEDARSYEPSSLAEEGFVHCSGSNQVARVADRLFTRRRDLLLLEIDPSLLSAEVVWEDLYDLEEEFPHVYGPIERSAVVRVRPYPPDEPSPPGRRSSEWERTVDGSPRYREHPEQVAREVEGPD